MVFLSKNEIKSCSMEGYDIVVSADTEGNTRLGNALPISIGICVCDVKQRKIVATFFVAIPPGKPDADTLGWISQHQKLFDASNKLSKVSIQEAAELLTVFGNYITSKFAGRRTQIWTDNSAYDIGRMNHLLGLIGMLPVRYLFSNGAEDLANDTCENYGSEVSIDDVISDSCSFSHADMAAIKDEVISMLFNPSEAEIEFHQNFWCQHNPLYDACYTALYYIQCIHLKAIPKIITVRDPRKWYQKIFADYGHRMEWIDKSGRMCMGLVNSYDQVIGDYDCRYVPFNINTGCRKGNVIEGILQYVE
jgi:hypothetical protein